MTKTVIDRFLRDESLSNTIEDRRFPTLERQMSQIMLAEGAFPLTVLKRHWKTHHNSELVPRCVRGVGWGGVGLIGSALRAHVGESWMSQRVDEYERHPSPHSHPSAFPQPNPAASTATARAPLWIW